MINNYDANYDSNQIAIAIISYGELYEMHLSLARKNASVEDWEKHVRRYAMPAFRRVTHEPFWGLTRNSITAVAEELKEHFETSVKEGA